MNKFKSYKDLLIWQKSIDLVVLVYEILKLLPKEEEFSLKSQLRRSAVSVPSNIAEGWGRDSDKQFLQFLYIARGSLLELETQIFIARRLNYLSQKTYSEIELLIIEVSKMLNSFINKLNVKIV